jgi:hypothetical protein
MEINKKNEKVIVKYKNDRISIYNADRTIGGILEISSNEIKNMYWGKEGKGVLHIQVIDDSEESSTHEKS